VHECREYLITLFSVVGERVLGTLRIPWGEDRANNIAVSGEYFKVFSVPGNRGRIYLNPYSSCAKRKRDGIKRAYD